MLDALKKYEIETWECWGTKTGGIGLRRQEVCGLCSVGKLKDK